MFWRQNKKLLIFVLIFVAVFYQRWQQVHGHDRPNNSNNSESSEQSSVVGSVNKLGNKVAATVSQSLNSLSTVANAAVTDTVIGPTGSNSANSGSAVPLADPVNHPEYCPQQFWRQHRPLLRNPKLAQRSHLLCYQQFAVFYSGLTKTPLYTAEHLTKELAYAAGSLTREDVFHEEKRLPAQDRSLLENYRRSGYDRGHSAPSGDMATPEAQAESFTMANMSPQNPNNNRGIWSGIEAATRGLAKQGHSLYVVTGALYHGNQIKSLPGGVLIPTHFFKAVLDETAGTAAAYLSPNQDGGAYSTLSIQELDSLTGFELFPGLPSSVASVNSDLPPPRLHGPAN